MLEHTQYCTVDINLCVFYCTVKITDFTTVKKSLRKRRLVCVSPGGLNECVWGWIYSSTRPLIHHSVIIRTPFHLIESYSSHFSPPPPPPPSPSPPLTPQTHLSIEYMHIWATFHLFLDQPHFVKIIFWAKTLTKRKKMKIIKLIFYKQ